MKNLMFTFFFVAFCSVASFAQGLGVGIQLLDIDDIGIQGRYEIALSAVENLEIVPAFTFYLGDFTPDFNIRACGHYNFAVGDGMDVYPLAGLSYYSFDGFSDTGLDIGGGVNFTLGSFRLFGELHLGLGDVDATNIDAGILLNL